MTVAARGVAPLTARERAVLDSMLEGDTMKSTAAKLGISPKTVETYRARIRAKYNAHNIIELVRVALEERASLRDAQAASR